MRASSRRRVARFSWLSCSISSLVSSHSETNLELILAEAEAEARGSEQRPNHGRAAVYDDVSEGDALLPAANKMKQAPAPAVAPPWPASRPSAPSPSSRTPGRRTAPSNDPEIETSGGGARRKPTIVISLLDDQGYADVPWLAQGRHGRDALRGRAAQGRGRRRRKNYHTWRDYALTGYASHRKAPCPAGDACAAAGGARPRSRRTSIRSGSSSRRHGRAPTQGPSSASGTWARHPPNTSPRRGASTPSRASTTR